MINLFLEVVSKSKDIEIGYPRELNLKELIPLLLGVYLILIENFIVLISH